MLLTFLLQCMCTKPKALYSKNEKRNIVSYEDQEAENNGQNPITSVVFDKNDNKHFITIGLSRKITGYNVFIMRSSNPDDVNSYVINRDVTTEAKNISGLRLRISLDGCELENVTYSIQLRNKASNIFQTEPFYYDSNAEKYMLLREKSSRMKLDIDMIIYICIGFFVVIFVSFIGYFIFVRK